MILIRRFLHDPFLRRVGSAEFYDIAGTAQDSNSGFYVVAEKDLVHDAESGRGFGVFTQLGFSEDDRNQLATYVGGGLNWTGPIASRARHVFGIAVAHARSGDDFRRLNPGMERAETTIEFTCRVTPKPWLSIQPDVQYIIDPGTDGRVDDALIVGFRLQVIL